MSDSSDIVSRLAMSFQRLVDFYQSAKIPTVVEMCGNQVQKHDMYAYERGQSVAYSCMYNSSVAPSVV